MTILQFTPGPHNKYRGGYYPFLESCRQISNAKIVDTVGCKLVDTTKLLDETEADYHLKVFNIVNFASYGIPREIHKLIAELNKLNDLELIVINTVFQFQAILASWLSKKHKIPYVVFLHGTLDPYIFSYRAMPKYLWMHFIGKPILQGASAVICTSTREAEKASQFLQGTNIEICPLGIEVPDLTQVPQWRDEIRQQLGISSSEKILLFLGRMTAIKRPIETAIAFKEMEPKDWIFLLVGNFERDMKHSDLDGIIDGNKIRYHTPIYGIQKWKFLAAADAFICLSHRENFGYSVVEAAAVGLPLLISDGVDIFPLFQEAEAADIVSIKSNEDIYKEMDRFLKKSKFQQAEMGRVAKTVFKENFSHNSFKQRLTYLLQKYS